MAANKNTLFLVVALLLWPWPHASGAVSVPDSSLQLLNTAGLHQPFIENRGQMADPAVVYVAETFACRVAVTRSGQIVYSMPRGVNGSQPAAQIKERPTGANVVADVYGRDPRAAKVSYFQGRNPAQWLRNLQSYGRLSLGRIDPGIRIELKAHARNVEKIFYLQPGADPASIRMAVAGVKGLRVTSDGELLLAGASETMRFSKPVAYQEIDGERHMVPVRYTVDGCSYGFETGRYDPSKELTIDPLIRVFAYKPDGPTKRNNAFMDLAADAQGNVYAAGYTNDQLAIFKLDRRLETLLATAYFSKDGRYWVDNIRSIAIDSRGNVFVAGITMNADFPVSNGCLDNDPGDLIIAEGFVTKFSADLSNILASTFIGGNDADDVRAMAIDAHDRVYVAGYSKTSAMDGPRFPVTSGAYDTQMAPRNQRKAVVARLSNDLTEVQAATYLGGSSDGSTLYGDIGHCLAIDGQGNVWVAGRTTQPDFPVITPGCLDPTYNGQGDVFLSKLDADLQQLLISTHIGGPGDEAPTGLLIDRQNNIYLLGWTFSVNFPVNAGGYSATHSNHEEDGFILKLNPSASSITAGTFLGGTADGSRHGDDVPADMALSADGQQLLVVGRTESKSFPTTPGCLDAVNENYAASLPDRDTAGDQNFGDGFITALDSDLSTIYHSTYVGSNGCEYLDAVLINGDDLLAAGETQTAAFPLAMADDHKPRAVLMRFNANETPGGPGDEPVTASSGGGGGGGGGCFLSNCSR